MKKITIRMITFLLTYAMIASYSGGTFAIAASKASEVKSVKVTNVTGKRVSIGKGKSFQLKTSVTVKKGSTVSKKLTYSSNKKAVATVSSSGVIKGKKYGTAKITVASKINKKRKASIKVTVKNIIKVTKIKLDTTSLKLYTEADDDDDEITDEYEMETTILPSKASNKNLDWSTSDDDVADVDDDGVILAITAGTAVITAKATDGSGVQATCKVTVVDNESDDDEDEGEEDEDDSNDDDDEDTDALRAFVSSMSYRQISIF